MQADFLIIGSGIAGLTFALKTAAHLPQSKVVIVSKTDEDESNTKYAQGGIAVVLDKNLDTFDLHIDDTLKAGDGLCNRDVVETVVKEGPRRLRELVDWGADFDMKTEGDYELGREGGHSLNRIVHHRDLTGLEIERALIAQVHRTSNIELLTYHHAIDLITEHHLNAKAKVTPGQSLCCFGAYVLNDRQNKVIKIVSKVTLLATGGTGQVYSNTTNPLIATGDGVAMACRAKALIQQIEFIQFHPTALYNPGDSPAFLISEAPNINTKDLIEIFNRLGLFIGPWVR